MARTPKPEKEPGRFAQMWQVFQMTRRLDKSAIWIMLTAFLVPLLAGIALAIWLSGDNVVGIVLYVIAGLLAGVLGLLIALGRRAERAAYSQIEGQPGAVGAVLRSSLRRNWQASEMPVSVSPRTQDAVYRAVGKGGVVLIGEGPRSRTQRLLDDERRNVKRVVPDVAVTYLYVGPDEGSVRLHQIPRALNRIRKTLSKAEVVAVSNRLNSLGKASMPIPKGIDPFRARAPRPR